MNERVISVAQENEQKYNQYHILYHFMGKKKVVCTMKRSQQNDNLIKLN